MSPLPISRFTYYSAVTRGPFPSKIFVRCDIVIKTDSPFLFPCAPLCGRANKKPVPGTYVPRTGRNARGTTLFRSFLTEKASAAAPADETGYSAAL